ncbi:MAG: outer membrane lipoprotein-sorting protein [Helicobacteraceae bacterium]|jgi:outer membrane lipoprotein-sorting protein|nr:outer membrane lipoprotein-sorting protein [Helicobacteraceae bacterium]
MRVLTLFALVLSFLFADEAYEIMKKVDQRDKGDLMSAKMRMILVDSSNKRRERVMRQFKKVEGDVTKKSIFFIEPADVKNTGFLTLDRKEGDDDQWLYLPSLRKTKRIASSDQSGSFMGSDFSYNDLNDRNLDDYTYVLQSETKIDDVACWTIEATPKNERVIETTGYTKSLLVVRKDNYVIVRAINYETQKSKVKYLDVPAIKLIDGIWQPTEMRMTLRRENVVAHSTILMFDEVRFNQKISAELFTIRGIENGL